MQEKRFVARELAHLGLRQAHGGHDLVLLLLDLDALQRALALLARLGLPVSFFQRISASLSSSRGQQAALKCDERSDSVTRE